MFKTLSFAALATFALADGSINMGQVTVNVDGQDTTMWAVGNNQWVKGSTDGNKSITLVHDDRAYLSTVNEDAHNPDNFYYFDLIGKKIEYDVTFGGVGCSCNAAIYSVQMPAMDYNGNAVAGDGGDYYCDANQVGGHWCPEMDFFEANEYVIATTPHKCDDPGNSKEYWNCDRGGCGTNSWYVDNNLLKPDQSGEIDTTQTFTQAVEFDGSGDNLNWMKSTLTQGSVTKTYDVCSNSGYFGQLHSAQMNHHTIVMSLWGTDWNTMSWLDQMTGCGGDCNEDSTVTFSNIKITTMNSAEQFTQ